MRRRPRAAEQLGAALAQNEARTRGAALLGQPLGGLLFGVGRLVPFLADGLSYAVSALTLTAIRAQFQEVHEPSRTRLRADIAEGLRFLWRHPFLRDCALLIAGSNLMFQALALDLIVLARGQGASPGAVGLVLGGLGAGGVVGALAAPLVQRRLAPAVVVIGANWVWAALVPLLAFAPGVVGLATIGAAMAFVGPAWNVVIGSYTLVLVPDRLRARVQSCDLVLAYGAIPLGSLAGGFLIGAVGGRGTALVFSGWMLAIAGAATAAPHVRRPPPLPGAGILAADERRSPRLP